jgi:hypothetical protein
LLFQAFCRFILYIFWNIWFEYQAIWHPNLEDRRNASIFSKKYFRYFCTELFYALK